MLGKQFFFFFLITYTVLKVHHAKLFSKNLFLNSFEKNKGYFLARFHSTSAEISFSLRVRFDNKPEAMKNAIQTQNITLFVFRRTNWDSLGKQSRFCQHQNLTEYTGDIEIPWNNTWTSTFQYKLRSENTDDLEWYFAIEDCLRTVPIIPSNSKSKLMMELNITNEDETHLTQDEAGLAWPLIIIFSLNLCIFIINTKILCLNKQNTSTEALFVLNFAVFSELLATALKLLEVHQIVSRGEDFSVLSIFSFALNMLSQYIVMGLFVLFSQGWTVVYHGLNRLGYLVPYLIFAGGAHGILPFLIKYLNQTNQHDSTYHRISFGWILLGLRLILFCYFIKQSLKTIRICRYREIRIFFKFLIAFGSIYFLSYFFILWFSFAFQLSLQIKAFYIITLVFQQMALFIFTWILVSNKHFLNICSLQNMRNKIAWDAINKKV